MISFFFELRDEFFEVFAKIFGNGRVGEGKGY